MLPVEADKEEKKSRAGIYRPPKVAPMPYSEAGSASAIERRTTMDKKSRMIRELREDYSQQPEEYRQNGSDEDVDQKRYEEENFVRLQSRKEHRKRLRKPFEDEMKVRLDVLIDRFIFNSST